MKIPPKVADVIRAVAPTLASALAGPLAPVAAVVVTAALDAWLPGGSGTAPRDPTKTAPADVVAAVQANADDPRFILDLQKAQLDIEAYERRLPQTFAELELQDRKDAREYSRDAGMARVTFFAGMGIVALALLMLFGVIAGCILALTGKIAIAPEQAQIAIAAFGLIGTVVGVFQGVAVQVIGFYFGSSVGSKDKSDQLGGALQDFGAALANQAPGKPSGATTVTVQAPQALPPPVDAQEGAWHQGPFGGQRWRTTAAGVIQEGDSAPVRTVGQPATVRRIWSEYGPLVERVCAEERVPLELLVATVATESGGRVNAALTEPDGRQSIGLTQILVGTARDMLGKPDLDWKALLEPEMNLRAGARYIARQRVLTGYQPPLVAAAYNAGDLGELRPGIDANRWKLRSTGDHISRFVSFFNDAVAVAAEDGWGRVDKAA